MCGEGPAPPQILGEVWRAGEGSEGDPTEPREENLAVEGGEEGYVWMKLLCRVLVGFVIWGAGEHRVSVWGPGSAREWPPLCLSPLLFGRVFI